MSFSFSVRAATKAAVKEAAAAQMADVVAKQPIHAVDSAAILAAASAHVDLLPDDETMDVSVGIGGSTTQVWNDGILGAVIGVGMSVSANLVARTPAA